MKSFFQKIFSKKGGSVAITAGENSPKFTGHQAGFVHHPYRDWQIMLIVFGILAVASVFWGFNFFRQVDSGKAFSAGEQAAVPVKSSTLLNQASLNAATSQFQAKALEYSTELSGGGSITDPSQ